MVAHLAKENILTSQVKDPVSYYKWPLTLLARERRKEAGNLLAWITDQCLTESGDLHSDRSGFHLEFHHYANLWLVLAAIRLGETRLTEKLLGFVLKHHNETTGGLAINRLGSMEDPLTTSFLGLALCALQENDLANRVVAYLTSCVDRQQEPDYFQLRTMPDGSFMKDVPQGADPKTYVIALGKEEESCYFLGAMCLFLAEYLERIGSNEAVIDLANRIAEILEHVGEKALSTIWAAKVAPGCVGLYAVTSHARYLKIAIPVIRAVLAGQTSSGYWLKNQKPWITVSAEQCYWLTNISNVAVTTELAWQL